MATRPAHRLLPWHPALQEGVTQEAAPDGRPCQGCGQPGLDTSGFARPHATEAWQATRASATLRSRGFVILLGRSARIQTSPQKLTEGSTLETQLSLCKIAFPAPSQIPGSPALHPAGDPSPFPRVHTWLLPSLQKSPFPGPDPVPHCPRRPSVAEKAAGQLGAARPAERGWGTEAVERCSRWGFCVPSDQERLERAPSRVINKRKGVSVSVCPVMRGDSELGPRCCVLASRCFPGRWEGAATSAKVGAPTRPSPGGCAEPCLPIPSARQSPCSPCRDEDKHLHGGWDAIKCHSRLPSRLLSPGPPGSVKDLPHPLWPAAFGFATSTPLRCAQCSYWHL